LSTDEQFQLSGEAAERYERCGARYFLRPCAPSLVNAARLSAGERVLDVACGTGVVTRIAAERVGSAGRVVGVDLNPGMLAVARSLPAPNGAPIEWLERSALDLGLEDASFDAVLCQQGLQFFPDKALALREMRRVLDRGGRLALSVWKGIGAYHQAVGDALARFTSTEAGARFCASRQVPTKGDLQRLATEAGFADAEVRIDRIDIRLPPIDEFTLQHWPEAPSHRPWLRRPPTRARKSRRASRNSFGAMPTATG
jgi:SAM-dependent methyltransferase